MGTILLGFADKDWLVIIASLFLILGLLEIRRMRRLFLCELNRKILPQLALELDEKDLLIYLRNDSPFLAQYIRIEDVALVLDDFGFNLGITIKFEEIGFLKPNDRVALTLKAVDKDQNFMPNLSEKLVSHLIGASFKIRVHFSNIENFRFCITFDKMREKFLPGKIEYLS